MATQLKTLEPAITLGDKLVQVGVLSWGGFKCVLDEFAKANLPLPKLAVDKLGGAFAEIQGCYNAAAAEGQAAGFASQQASAKLYELLATLLAENLETLRRWFLSHPPILSALVRESSNLSAEEVDRLSAGESLRVARAAWSALTADGFFTQAAGFFGDLVGLRPPDRPASPNQPPGEVAPGQVAPSDSKSP